MTRTRITTLAALLLAALFLTGCGGSGGGEPTVTQTLHDELQAELDAALADLKKERKAKADEEAARETAEGAVRRLRGELETATDNVTRLTDELATATTGVGRLTAQLTTANNNVESLTDRIGTADDADSLQGMLAAEKARVTTLMNQIGSADDAASDAEGASLHAQLKTANEEVTRLTGELGTATDMADAAGSLHAQLAAEKAKVERLTGEIGDATDNANAAGSLHAQLKAAEDEVMRIQGLLDTADGRVEELEMLIGDAVNPSSTSLRGQLAVAKSEAATLRGQLAGARDDVTEAEDRADQAEREADQRVAEIERQGDTNARAQGLLKALEAVYDTAPEADALYDDDDWRVSGNPASAGINTRQTDIELTASPLTGSTRRSGNFYTATLTRTAPGVNRPEHKTVVYTDREKTRTFANHYARYIATVVTVGGTTSSPRFVNDAWVGDLRAQSSIVSNPSRGGHQPLIAADADDPADPRLVSTLSASVHGVSGHYGCYNSTTNAACRVSVAATYVDEGAPTDARKELATLTISAETVGSDTTTLYFDPGGTSISLLGAPKTGVPVTTDEQYITFGWWQERPALVDGTYQAAVFAAPTGGTYSGATGSAEYEGPAVGLYVDRTSEGGETIYESGDFTATAILRATFSGDNVGVVGVEGDVSGFRTTHGAKNWVVDLGRVSTIGDDGTAEIVETGTSGTGRWTHDFLQRHGNALPANVADDQPISVTGRFDVSIENVRHIVGAFGAHRTTDPIGQ